MVIPAPAQIWGILLDIPDLAKHLEMILPLFHLDTHRITDING
jgi:hypothetical protein